MELNAFLRAGAAGAALLAVTASADITVSTVSEKDGTPFSTTYVASGKVRAETFKGEAAYVLWQTGGNSMTTVLPNRQQYMTMDAAQMKAAAQQASGAMKQAEQMMASLSPEQRKMMQQYAPNMGSGKPLIELKFTKTGKTMSKGGYTCQVVDLTVSGAPAMMGDLGSEYCVVEVGKLGIPAADLQTLKAMADWTTQLTKEFGQFVSGGFDPNAMGGWPVWSREKRTGESWVLKTVTKSVSGVSFAVPAGFKQVDMMSSAAGMGAAAGGMPAMPGAQDPTKKKKKKNKDKG